MRLINTTTLEVKSFEVDNEIPPYAILSHTWGDEEASFSDTAKSGKAPATTLGFRKIKECADQARQQNIDWCWVDTLCIDRTSTEELSDAINSMFKWYRQASVCYAYISDVPPLPAHDARIAALPQVEKPSQSVGGMFSEHLGSFDDDETSQWEQNFSQSRWFTRGWTLLELVAPKSLEFYGSDWQFMGSRKTLSAFITTITSIPSSVLDGTEDLYACSVAQRMSWAARRVTSRAEDAAYSLLGVFNVNMPILYGEGFDKAFSRLQKEIMDVDNDMTIFCWEDASAEFFNYSGILAKSPSQFVTSKLSYRPKGPLKRFRYLNKAFRITLGLTLGREGYRNEYLAVFPFESDSMRRVGIYLAQIGEDLFARVDANTSIDLDPRKAGFVSIGKVNFKTIWVLENLDGPVPSVDLRRVWGMYIRPSSSDNLCFLPSEEEESDASMRRFAFGGKSMKERPAHTNVIMERQREPKCTIRWSIDLQNFWKQEILARESPSILTDNINPLSTLTVVGEEIDPQYHLTRFDHFDGSISIFQERLVMLVNSCSI